MIDIPQDVLKELIFKSLICGALLGIFYDVIRAIRMFFGVYYAQFTDAPRTFSGKFFAYTVTFITDVIFWVCGGCVSIALLYSMGGGRFRGIVYLALAIGFAVYYFTFGRLMLKISAFTVRLLKKWLKLLVKCICFPIRQILRAIISLYHLTFGRIIGKIKVAVRRWMKKSAAEANVAEFTEKDGGKEDLICTDGKYRYRKEGRICFGRRADR